MCLGVIDKILSEISLQVGMVDLSRSLVTYGPFPPAAPAQLPSTRPAFSCVSIAKMWYLVRGTWFLFPGTILVSPSSRFRQSWSDTSVWCKNRLLATDWPECDTTGRILTSVFKYQPQRSASGSGRLETTIRISAPEHGAGRDCGGDAPVRSPVCLCVACFAHACYDDPPALTRYFSDGNTTCLEVNQVEPRYGMASWAGTVGGTVIKTFI